MASRSRRLLALPPATRGSSWRRARTRARRELGFGPRLKIRQSSAISPKLGMHEIGRPDGIGEHEPACYFAEPRRDHLPDNACGLMIARRRHHQVVRKSSGNR